MNQCKKCQGELIAEQLPSFAAPVTLLGIGGVEVRDAVEVTKCSKCGLVARTTIPDLSELIAAVAVWRIMLPVKFNGTEIRFIRQALGWTQVELGEQIAIGAETISRWENDEKVCAQANERILRMIAGARLSKEAPGIHFDSDKIAAMPIAGPRGASDVIPMSFCRVLVTPEKEAWNPQKAKVA